jgi:positive regulator of sigma E activity
MRDSHCLTADAVVTAAHADGCVDLEFQPAVGCAACAGTCLWKRLQSTRIESLQSSREFTPGTRVSVSLPERRVLAASVLVYGLPLAAIVVGAATGAAVGGDLATLAGSAAGLGVSALAFRPLGRRLERATLTRLTITPRA